MNSFDEKEHNKQLLQEVANKVDAIKTHGNMNTDVQVILLAVSMINTISRFIKITV